MGCPASAQNHHSGPALFCRGVRCPRLARKPCWKPGHMQKGILECVTDFIDGLGDVISEGFTVCLGAAPRQAAQFLQLTRTHRQYRHKNGTGSMCGDRSSRMCIWYMGTVSRPRGCRRMLDSGHGKAQIHLTAGWNKNCLTA
mmetsp:Transcript_38759/g.92601  ORF Transcript_38759/g.92601 Transcript_38759/m.92601 type:complete len:142 (+) Transcript_38759:1355-1780(+)